jgi:hypothetical protein
VPCKLLLVYSTSVHVAVFEEIAILLLLHVISIYIGMHPTSYVILLPKSKIRYKVFLRELASEYSFVLINWAPSWPLALGKMTTLPKSDAADDSAQEHGYVWHQKSRIGFKGFF